MLISMQSLEYSKNIINFATRNDSYGLLYKQKSEYNRICISFSSKLNYFLGFYPRTNLYSGSPDTYRLPNLLFQKHDTK